ncbi:NADPH-dependent FMN reductase [Teredinibacter purpureus]|jgi:Predicted flavoprotein|uniref:NADPH-dependent FMN reductase n=1 Tax=Teredinibacter purpureus TaxID=2731756 RepID=UPI0005F772CD|nr:NAD(P)H-dependent oxidoreductase [Teredinibacter purpureus]
MKILAFAASSSAKSINKQLIRYSVTLLPLHECEVIDLRDYELPIFSVDKEMEGGIPQLALQLFERIGTSDALIISYAEHNGSYSAAYKNIFDWMSRINPKVFQNKPMVLLATSPGPGGAKNVLEAAGKSAPYFGGQLKASLSVPTFFDNFSSEEKRITNDDINQKLKAAFDTLGAP